MVYNSLTEAPRNLKEGIDWLMALRGTDAVKNSRSMGAALYNFFSDKLVGFKEVPALEEVKVITKKFLEKPELKDRSYVKGMLKRYNGLMDKNPKKIGDVIKGVEESDYKNVVKARGVKPEDITKSVSEVVHGCEKFLKHIKAPDQYKSAYSSEASWETSCAKDPEACAVVLVGIAPMLYTGILSLWDASNPPVFGCRTPGAAERLRKVLKAVGYAEPESRNSLSRDRVRKALSNMHKNVLDTIYDFAAYWAFY
ncbi:hypothetical protein, conserved [Babesia ovata]|uniref:Uncharacterized protein n=1 Tax=Babesia ovata TaxID=189622 RepID=A0A2H6K7Y5_9APIC|nr:uncharacterized protein BOVATA_005990 [Babesia ovata]GBE59106.1 hypothetical protein, conserved [Babesia ovata]